jgi:SAM-dependent methyltransferase
VFQYQYENGRRYHAFRAGKYLLPNDETEQDRLDITHHIFRLSLGGDLCATQLQHPHRILDIGTGTGIWAIEMGDLFPDAEVTGTDLSPTQPPFVPPNVQFVIEDASETWTFARNHFDFIHARTLAGSIQDWPKFLRQCYDHLKPGGKVEIAEGRANFWYVGESVSEKSFTYQWLMEWRRLSAQLQFDVFPALPSMAERLPFENIRTVEKVCPLGSWPKDKSLKEIGRWFKVQFLDMALEAYTLALFSRQGGWQDLEIRALLAKVREEMAEGKMYIYTFWCVFFYFIFWFTSAGEDLLTVTDSSYMTAEKPA